LEGEDWAFRRPRRRRENPGPSPAISSTSNQITSSLHQSIVTTFSQRDPESAITYLW